MKPYIGARVLFHLDDADCPADVVAVAADDDDDCLLFVMRPGRAEFIYHVAQGTNPGMWSPLDDLYAHPDAKPLTNVVATLTNEVTPPFEPVQ